MKFVTANEFFNEPRASRTLLVTVNAQHCYQYLFSPDLRRALSKATFTLDSRPIYYILRMFRPDLSLAQGSDCLDDLCSNAEQFSRVLAIGGSTDGTPTLHENFPKLPVMHFTGNVDADLDQWLDQHVDSLRQEKGRVLVLMFIGVPKQEILFGYIEKKIPSLSFDCLCLGGSLDIWCGKFRRAPKLLQIFMLESIWRLASDMSTARLMRLFQAVCGIVLSPIVLRKMSYAQDNGGRTFADQ
jgi:UDP-N-acetyl-D-mannosaminouronate:lipid I N-acetyl-D-mannosaminouronosyltransferase